MNTHIILETFAYASFLGVVLLAISYKYKISAIILLLIGGVLAGPEFLNIINPKILGNGLNVIVSIAVGLILFEGGLTLNVNGYKNVSKEVTGILTWGILITWITTAILILIFFKFSIVFSLLSSSLIIVTGPTVIGPLLQRIKVKKKLHHILHWEGVLIDPIGVFITLLCYEWIISSFSHDIYLKFIYRFVAGLLVGLIFGYITIQILKNNFIKDKFINIFIVTSMILNFAISDLIISESGLLSVVVSGLYLGYKKSPKLASIVEYNIELKDYFIGLLFILLAANLSLQKFTIYGYKLIIIVILVIFFVRPLNIFLSTLSSTLTVKEKLFLSWIAPRGIVAASMASLFTYKLSSKGYANSDFLEAFTYTIISATILIQGLSAKKVGKLLGVLDSKADGWLIIGAHKLARQIGQFLTSIDKNTILVDTNFKNIKLAKKIGLQAIYRDGKLLNPDTDIELIGIGNLLAITENEELNQIICSQWKPYAESVNLFYWNKNQASSLISATAIWQNLDLKHAVSDNSSPFICTANNSEDLKNLNTHNNTILLTKYNDSIRPYSSHNNTLSSFPIECLVYHPINIVSELATKKEWIFITDKSNLFDIYKMMIDSLKNRIKDIDIENILREIIKREEEFTNLIGHGVSLPHLYIKSLSKSIFLFAKTTKPIPCKHTKEDISMIFIVLSPTENQTEHLNLLAWIANFLIDKNNINKLQHAATTEELFQLFKNEIQNNFNNT